LVMSLRERVSIRKARHSTSGRESGTRGYTPAVMRPPEANAQAAPARALFEMFERHARGAPGRMMARTAGDGLSINATALLHRVVETAGALRHEGIGRGDLVLPIGLGGIPFVEAMLAIWARDAAALACDAQLAAAE